MFLCGIELMDPRSVPLDGGVFSRSIPVSSHTPRLGMLAGASSDIKSKCWEQYQHFDFTSLDGSRRRFFQIQINLISHMELCLFFCSND